MSIVSNRYGKTRVRVLKVDKNPGKRMFYYLINLQIVKLFICMLIVVFITDLVHDYSVQVLLEGDFETAYTEGDNSMIFIYYLFIN
jgi:urate oxidase